MQRLKTRAQFEAVMAGSIVSRTPHFALHRLALEAPRAFTPDPRSDSAKPLFAVRDAWVGAMLPKRWAKRAVTRNAIKRQIYTVSQHLEPPLPPAAHVVRLRAEFDRAQFVSAWSDALRRAVRAELQALFAQAQS